MKNAIFRWNFDEILPGFRDMLQILAKIADILLKSADFFRKFAEFFDISEVVHSVRMKNSIQSLILIAVRAEIAQRDPALLAELSSAWSSRSLWAWAQPEHVEPKQAYRGRVWPSQVQMMADQSRRSGPKT